MFPPADKLPRPRVPVPSFVKLKFPPTLPANRVAFEPRTVIMLAAVSVVFPVK